MPGISVIVPVYQAEKFLVNCVESVKKQTFTDWELILVDDGCTDASPAICDRLAAEDDRIRVFHRKKNGGVSAARNIGLNEARGECIAFLDSDDRFEFRALETLWHLREQSGADTVGCAHLNLSADGSKSIEPLLPAGVYDEQGIRDGIIAPLLGDRLRLPIFNGFIWRYLFSTEIIRSARITFTGAYLEDELFLLEYFCHARKLAVSEEPLYRYFLNPNSATHKYMKNFAKTFARFVEKKAELVKKHGLSEAFPQWREYTNWAGIIIFVGNEYAAGNPISVREKQKAVKAYCKQPEMAKAIAEITPIGLSPNKQMVANFIKGNHFFILTQLYRLKNRI